MPTILRKILFSVLAGGCVLAAAAPARANDADRRALAPRLALAYVARPNASPAPAPEMLDPVAIAGGTEAGSFWGNASVAHLQRLVRGLLRDTGHGGNDLLQYYARRLVEITPGTGRILVYLFDDVTAPLTAQAEANFGGCITPAGRAWPCAIDWDGRSYDGAMWLGAHYFANGGRYSTFLHELTHTQDKTDGRPHLFTINRRTYRYGSDDVHYDVEVIPNLAMSYKEGIANAIALRYDGSSQVRYFNLFATNGLLWVEKTVPPATSGVSPDIWLYSQLQAARVPEEPMTPALRAQFTANLIANYAPFRFRSLPPRFLIHNEYALALMISWYLDYADESRFFRAIRAVNRTLHRSSGSGIAVLFESLGSMGLPPGESIASLAAARVSTPGPKPYMLPLGFADYFTSYRSRSDAEFGQIFESLLPNNWTSLYWTAHQPIVRSSVPFSTARRPESGDLTNIAIALGITSSTPD